MMFIDSLKVLRVSLFFFLLQAGNTALAGYPNSNIQTLDFPLYIQKITNSSDFYVRPLGQVDGYRHANKEINFGDLQKYGGPAMSLIPSFLKPGQVAVSSPAYGYGAQLGGQHVYYLYGESNNGPWYQRDLQTFFHAAFRASSIFCASGVFNSKITCGSGVPENSGHNWVQVNSTNTPVKSESKPQLKLTMRMPLNNIGPTYLTLYGQSASTEVADKVLKCTDQNNESVISNIDSMVYNPDANELYLVQNAGGDGSYGNVYVNYFVVNLNKGTCDTYGNNSGKPLSRNSKISSALVKGNVQTRLDTFTYEEADNVSQLLSTGPINLPPWHWTPLSNQVYGPSNDNCLEYPYNSTNSCFTNLQKGYALFSNQSGAGYLFSQFSTDNPNLCAGNSLIHYQYTAIGSPSGIPAKMTPICTSKMLSNGQPYVSSYQNLVAAGKNGFSFQDGGAAFQLFPENSLNYTGEKRPLENIKFFNNTGNDISYYTMNNGQSLIFFPPSKTQGWAIQLGVPGIPGDSAAGISDTQTIDGISDTFMYFEKFSVTGSTLKFPENVKKLNKLIEIPGNIFYAATDQGLYKFTLGVSKTPQKVLLAGNSSMDITDMVTNGRSLYLLSDGQVYPYDMLSLTQ